uniref:Putative secreted protein n=1 Tax=Anopheles marajoara TaxID=58244 RepID=A0A2M4CFD1_9DIPT
MIHSRGQRNISLLGFVFLVELSRARRRCWDPNRVGTELRKNRLHRSFRGSIWGRQTLGGHRLDGVRSW